jgi:acyl carrier protein
MNHQSIVTTTRAFIVENFLYTRPEFFIDEDLPLLGEGIVDSMGVMEVIAFLETDFGVVTEGKDIREENLGSLGGIARWVLSQKQPATGELNAA